MYGKRWKERGLMVMNKGGEKNNERMMEKAVLSAEVTGVVTVVIGDRNIPGIRRIEERGEADLVYLWKKGKFKAWDPLENTMKRVREKEIGIWVVS